jgi:hypothetical protein
MTTQHEHRTPGNDEDVRAIHLAVKHVQQIKQLLILNKFRKVVHDMLKELQGALACYRRPHYEDIRNTAKKNAGTTYRKDGGDHTSFDV